MSHVSGYKIWHTGLEPARLPKTRATEKHASLPTEAGEEPERDNVHGGSIIKKEIIMTTEEFMKALADVKVCPVVVLDDAEDAVPLAKALEAGKLPMAEVTFRTAAAADSIAKIAKEVPGVIVGAGTVLDREQCARAINAGAQFIVSPSFSDEVAQYAIGHGVAYCPGTCTPTDITNALRYNLPMVKFFPAGAYGGLKTIKALSSVFPQLKFMPTGGVNTENVNEYLGFDKIICVGGTWVCKKDKVAAHDWDGITKLCQEAYDLTHKA